MHVHVHTVPHARVAPSHHLRINAVESKKTARCKQEFIGFGVSAHKT